MSLSQRELLTTSKTMDVDAADRRLHQGIQSAISKALGTLAHHRRLCLAVQGKDPRTMEKYKDCQTREYALGIFCTLLRSELTTVVYDIYKSDANRTKLMNLWSTNFWTDVGVPRRYATSPINVGLGWTIDLAKIRKMCDSKAPEGEVMRKEDTSSTASQSIQSTVSSLDSPTLEQEIKGDLKSLDGSLNELKILLGKVDQPQADLKRTTAKTDLILESA